MDVTWFVPSAVLLAGAAATAVLLRRIGSVVESIETSRRRVRRLEDSLVTVQVETRRARRSLDHLDRR